MTLSLVTVAIVAVIYSLFNNDYDKQDKYLTIVVAIVVAGLAAFLEIRFHVKNIILLYLGIVMIFAAHFRALRKQDKKRDNKG